jgi:phage tail sheath protein FI
LDTDTLDDLKLRGSQDYLLALNALAPYLKMTLPPSALLAGVYAKTDREKGVWKAPANIALQGVVKPMVAISDNTQDALNVDATTGKSINAIRSFAGQGTLVWGARTLAGNSNEWRYIPVRRLFITVEESVKKAIAQFVFENNDAKTWVKVSSMVNSYLNGIWKEGALLGAKAEDAYFVNVGLGTTMTAQDVLEGKMIVRIGLSAVRPAEFIVLEFSHFINQ